MTIQYVVDILCVKLNVHQYIVIVKRKIGVDIRMIDLVKWEEARARASDFRSINMRKYREKQVQGRRLRTFGRQLPLYEKDFSE